MEETQASNSTDSSSISRKRPFVCIECGKTYSSQRNLNKHTKVQHQQVCPKQAHGKNKCLKAVCGICDKRFTPTNIPRHLVYCHKQMIALTCAECGEKVAHGSLFTHLAEAHGAVKCLLCLKKFGSQVSYNNHISEVHCQLPSSDPSPLCSDSSKRRKLESGTAEDPKDAGMVCGICGQRYKRGYRFYRHLVQHEKQIRPGEWICTKCWTVVPDIEVLKHKQECKLREPTVTVSTSIAPRRDFPCVVCGKAFATKYNAISHMKRVHQEDQVHQSSENTVQTEKLNNAVSFPPVDCVTSTLQSEPLTATCGICSKNLDPNKTTKHMYSQHNYTSSSECEKCGEKVNNCGFLWHLVTEHGVVECRLCTRKFASVRSFSSHINQLHASFKESSRNVASAKGKSNTSAAKQDCSLICGICEQAFFQTISLYRHILRHSRAVPNDVEVCMRCGLVLSLTEILEHRRRHEDEQCKMCGEVFASKAKLCIHIKQVHSACT